MHFIYKNKRFLQGIVVLFEDLAQIFYFEGGSIHFIKGSVEQGSDDPCQGRFPTAGRAVKEGMGQGVCGDESL